MEELESGWPGVSYMNLLTIGCQPFVPRFGLSVFARSGSPPEVSCRWLEAARPYLIPLRCTAAFCEGRVRGRGRRLDTEVPEKDAQELAAEVLVIGRHELADGLLLVEHDQLA